MSGSLDAARPVRPEDAPDLESLTPYLAARIDGLEPPLVVEQFPGGHSNLTFLLRDAAGREFVLRRPPRGAAIATAHDMAREARTLRSIRPHFPRVPGVLAESDADGPLGVPFYVMERLRGVILRSATPAIVPAPAQMQRLSTSLVDDLALLHGLDLDATGLRDLGRPEGYARRQIEGWTKRYFAAKTDEIPEIERTAAWLAERIPAEGRPALIHNDWKYDNVVLDPDDLGRIIGVLDWEMATVGDPALDLGTALGYWVDPDDSDEMKMMPLGPTTLPGNLSRSEIVARWASQTGRAPGDPVWLYTYGLFKVAVIAQQIYARFKSGHSSDPRFAAMIMGVMILGRQAVRAIDAGRIDELG
jgi:aminoglycoside phosphotransferase (APT) family kinase protein